MFEPARVCDVLIKGEANGGKRDVTFVLPPEVGGTVIYLCGDFNDWSQTSIPMELQADGSYQAVVMLEVGHRYRYRYLIDGGRWENDWRADTYVLNEFGGEDSAVDA